MARSRVQNRLMVAAAMFVCGACATGFDIDDRRYSCSQDAECGPDFVCLSGRCAAPSTSRSRDAGPRPDSGMMNSDAGRVVPRTDGGVALELVNGGFEEGLDGWLDYRYASLSTVGHSGGHSVEIRAMGTGVPSSDPGHVSQIVHLANNVTTISVWTRSSTPIDGRHSVELEVTPRGPVNVQISCGGPNAPDEWVQSDCGVTQLAGEDVTITIYNYDPTHPVLIDDVTIH